MDPYDDPKENLNENQNENRNENRNENQNENQNEKKSLKFGDVDEKEIDIFVKMLKRWLVKYNNWNRDENSEKTCISPNSCYINSLLISSDNTCNVIMNKKSNFMRVKIFIDYLELSLRCSGMSEALLIDFVKFSKFVQNLAKRILVASQKIKQETTVFTDLILLNYPDLISKISLPNFQKILKTNPKRGGILGFDKAYVMKVRPPTFLLWCKKILYGCDCKGRRPFFQKFFNIFKFQSNKERNFNTNLYDTFCDICRKEYIQDKNSDIFIECQEITVAIDTEENCLINNIITVWAYGNFINSVQEGDEISLITFCMPNNTSNFYEKDFEYGHFVALNFNVCFEPTVILKEENFLVEFPKNVIENVLKKEKFSSKFNENLEIEILRSVKFQRQLITNMNKLLFNNFISNYSVNSEYTSYLQMALDLSLVQRDYLNKVNKVVFFDSESLEKSKNKINVDTSSLTQSRNVLFKTKIFEKNDYKEKHEEEIRKYFRLTRQTDYQKIFTNSQQYSLTRPLHLFFIFDDLNEHQNPLVRSIYACKNKYRNVVSVYPFMNNTKFSKESLLKYFITCNNGVIIIPDADLLSKNEVEIISSVMSGSFHEYNTTQTNLKLNISLWILSSYLKLNKGGKKGRDKFGSSLVVEVKSKLYKTLIDKCEIVLNYSKYYNSMRGVELDICCKNSMIKKPNFIADFSLNVDNSVEDFVNQKSDTKNIILNKLQKQTFKEDLRLLKQYSQELMLEKTTLCKDNHFFSKKLNSSEDFNDSFSSAKLMEDYFIIKRNLSNVNFDDLFSLLRISTFNSFLRSNYTNEKIIFPKTIANLNYLDVIMAIFFYEEFSVFKYGLECSSFGNLIPKIMYKNLSEEFAALVNECNACKKTPDDKDNKAPVPKSRNSVRKVMINENNNLMMNLKREEDVCVQCNRLLRLSVNEKIEDFIEKFTVYTYNN